MSNITHIKTVRAGEQDTMNHAAHSRVHCDGSTFFYDLSEVSLEEFKEFIESAFDTDEGSHVAVEIYDAERGTFRAWVD